jgi:PKD repeat protein
VFNAVGSAGSDTDLTLTRGDLNEGGIPTDLQHGNLYIARPVQAAFTASPTIGVAPLTVVFTNTSTGDYDTCAWTFGDGGTSSDCNDPSYTYNSGGVYTVTLTVSGSGGSDTETKVEYITVYLLDISGEVRFWQGAAGVPGVLLTLDGDNVYTGTTGTTGAYTVTGVLAGDYTLTPSKSDGVNGITAYDASFVLRHAAGLITLTGHQATAAEVTKNGGITSMDASYILQKAVDLITLPFPGASVVWDFDPRSRSYTGLSGNLSGQDFTAILLGDVSGNWSAGVGQAQAQAATASLALPNLYAEPGERITVTLTITREQAEVYGVDILVTYDPTVVSAASVSAGDAAQGFQIASNLNQPGLVRVAMASAQPIADDGHLLALVFDVVGELGDTSPLQITAAELNEGGVTAQPQDGSVEVVNFPNHDFNRDCIVDVADIMKVASRWRMTEADPDWDARYDFDGDGIITVVDIMKVAANWGVTCW